MGDEWRTYEIEFEPFPMEEFAENAQIQCVGNPLKDHRGNDIGTIVSYRVVDGRLLMKARIG
jgi:hypothetical protein